MNQLPASFCGLLFLVAMIAGCGDGKITVTGSVSYENEIPEEGTIAFIADNGAGTTYGEPYSNGKYHVRLPEGTYRVRITGRKMIPLDKPLPGVLGGPPITVREENIIPDKYGLHSSLQVDVSKSAKKHNFDLKESGDK